MVTRVKKMGTLGSCKENLSVFLLPKKCLGTWWHFFSFWGVCFCFSKWKVHHPCNHSHKGKQDNWWLCRDAQPNSRVFLVSSLLSLTLTSLVKPPCDSLLFLLPTKPLPIFVQLQGISSVPTPDRARIQCPS